MWDVEHNKSGEYFCNSECFGLFKRKPPETITLTQDNVDSYLSVTREFKDFETTAIFLNRSKEFVHVSFEKVQKVLLHAITTR